MNENITAQKNVIVTENKVKESVRLSSNYYQGILLTREGLTGYLTEAFTQEGIVDQIPMAQAVVLCESGFQIDPPHNNNCRGLVQFKPSTWEYVTNKGWCSGELMNPQRQLECMATLWKMGYKNWWECYTMIK